MTDKTPAVLARHDTATALEMAMREYEFAAYQHGKTDENAQAVDMAAEKLRTLFASLAQQGEAVVWAVYHEKAGRRSWDHIGDEKGARERLTRCNSAATAAGCEYDYHLIPLFTHPAAVAVDEAMVESVRKAMRRAFALGQTYWQQADSDYTSQHRKADETMAKFKALTEETAAALHPAATSEGEN